MNPHLGATPARPGGAADGARQEKQPQGAREAAVPVQQQRSIAQRPCHVWSAADPPLLAQKMWL